MLRGRQRARLQQISIKRVSQAHAEAAWNASTINGNKKRRNGILNNELYLGNIIYNRQSFVRDPETGKRRSRPNPEALWVTKHVPHLQIIDEEIWDKAHAIKAKYASQCGNKRQTRKRLLTGLVSCGCCGWWYDDYWAREIRLLCPQRTRHVHQCDQHQSSGVRTTRLQWAAVYFAWTRRDAEGLRGGVLCRG